MRTPQDLPANSSAPRTRHRGRWWLIAGIAVLVVLIASLKSLATLYTDSLWFSSVHQHEVWANVLEVKLGLFACFGAIFFVVLWGNLLVCDRLGATVDPNGPHDDDLVRRYQHGIRPYARRVYAALALVVALIAASGTVGEWQNWILFIHGQSFGKVDPQFHWDLGFFIFRLPFLMFVVNWALISLIVVIVITAVFHYLNGGIRAQRVSPRVRPAVKVHLSVLLAGVALIKAAGYWLGRYQLDVSHNGYVQGAAYTDVHARLPALSLLVLVSLAAAVILMFNIRQRGWTLPVLAVGTWAFVALAVGVIYPALLQAFKVTPAQSTLEQPYITRNIAATRAAYGLTNVATSSFQGAGTVSAQDVASSASTLNNIRLWDPDPQIALQTFQRLQSVRTYYQFQSLGVDRYTINGQLTPVLVGVRQINPQNLPSTSWVNTHLQYTHGLGVALAEANQATSAGNPAFGVQDVPPTSSAGLPQLTNPDVYFGLNDPGYVVANSRQSELDYQLGGNGSNFETHYQANGGVQLNSFLTRAAFALRLGDFNLLISNLITPKSRILFVRDVQAMAQKVAPFLSYDADPYAVVVNGHVDWVLDAYTTTSQYPYSQNASTQLVPQGSGLPGSYNYVRNSVKVVIDAYTGKMTFYDMTSRANRDPLLETYEAEFPHLFTPGSAMPAALVAHLRYPEDMFSIQAAIYGRYHITSTVGFYNSGDAWNISPTAGAGSPNQALAVNLSTNAQGQTIVGPLARQSPIYQVFQPPGSSTPVFNISDAYVPSSNVNGAGGGAQGNQDLSAFLMAGSPRPGFVPRLHVYVTPNGQNVMGPVQADSLIQATGAVSSEITLLDQHGSQVLLGNLLMVPVGQAVLYVRPLYVTSTANSLPQLRDVIAVLGQNVSIEPTAGAALTKLLGTPVGAVGAGGVGGAGGGGAGAGVGAVPTGVAAQVQSDLAAAAAEYTMAQNALKAGDLGTYAADVNQINALVAAAQKLLTASTPASGTGAGSSAGGASAGGTGASGARASGSGSSSGSGSGSRSTASASHSGSTATSAGSGSSSSSKRTGTDPFFTPVPSGGSGSKTSHPSSPSTTSQA